MLNNFKIFFAIIFFNVLKSCNIKEISKIILNSSNLNIYSTAVDYSNNNKFIALGKSQNQGFNNNEISIFQINNNGTIDKEIFTYIDNQNLDPYYLKYLNDNLLAVINPANLTLSLFNVNNNGYLSYSSTYNLQDPPSYFAISKSTYNSNNQSYRTLAVLSQQGNSITILKLINNNLEFLQYINPTIIKFNISNPTSLDYFVQSNYLILANFGASNIEPSLLIFQVNTDGSLSLNNIIEYTNQNLSIFNITIYSTGIVTCNPVDNKTFVLTDVLNNAIYLFTTDGNGNILNIENSLNISANILNNPYFCTYSSDGKNILVNNKSFGQISIFNLNNSFENFSSYKNNIISSNELSLIAKFSSNNLYILSLNLIVNKTFTNSSFVLSTFNTTSVNSINTKVNQPITFNLYNLISQDMCINIKNLNIKDIGKNPPPSNGILIKDNNNEYTYTYIPFNNFSGKDKIGFITENKIDKSYTNNILDIIVKPEAKELSFKTYINEPLTISSLELTKYGGTKLKLNSFQSQPLHGSNNYEIVYNPLDKFKNEEIINYNAQDFYQNPINSSIIINLELPIKNIYVSTKYNLPIKIDPLKYIICSSNLYIYKITKPKYGKTKIINNYIIYKPNLGHIAEDKFICYLKDNTSNKVIKLTINVYTLSYNKNSLISVYISRKYLC